MQHIKSYDELKELVEKNSNVVVDFFATWCGPCKMLSPLLEELAEAHQEIIFVKVDVDEADELAAKFGIRSIPTVLYYKNGEVKAAELGFQPKDKLEANLTKYFN